MDEALGRSSSGFRQTEGGFDDFEFEAAFIAVEHDAVAFPWLRKARR